MNGTPVFEDDLSDWLEDGPTDAPDRVLDTVLAAFPSIPQRRVASRAPWRSLPMNGYARALAGIAAVAVIALGGLLLFNRPPLNQVGGSPSASKSPSVSPSASPALSSIDTSTWASFTSARHGVAVRYPADWTATPATSPWPAETDTAEPPDPMLDTFTSPTSVTFAVVSQPLPNGVTGDAWLATHEASGAARFPAYSQCWPAPADMERTTIDGLPAWLDNGCGAIDVFVFAGGRVYEITGYVDTHLNRPLFDAFLSTLTLDPTKADDTPWRVRAQARVDRRRRCRHRGDP